MVINHWIILWENAFFSPLRLYGENGVINWMRWVRVRVFEKKMSNEQLKNSRCRMDREDAKKAQGYTFFRYSLDGWDRPIHGVRVNSTNSSHLPCDVMGSKKKGNERWKIRAHATGQCRRTRAWISILRNKGTEKVTKRAHYHELGKGRYKRTKHTLIATCVCVEYRILIINTKKRKNIISLKRFFYYGLSFLDQNWHTKGFFASSIATLRCQSLIMLAILFIGLLSAPVSSASAVSSKWAMSDNPNLVAIMTGVSPMWSLAWVSAIFPRSHWQTLILPSYTAQCRKVDL